MASKSFHIGDILTITTGHLVSKDHIGGAYNILNWMTNDSLFTHQLPRASEFCEPYLKRAFPDIAEVEYPTELEQTEEAVLAWVDSMAELHGEWHEVHQLREGVWTHKDPFVELEEKLAPNQEIIAVVVDNA